MKPFARQLTTETVLTETLLKRERCFFVLPQDLIESSYFGAGPGYVVLNSKTLEIIELRYSDTDVEAGKIRKTKDGLEISVNFSSHEACCF